jgi:butyryl-CoA dehydrogenase
MFPLPPLRPEQRALVESMQVLAAERFRPRAAQYDEESSFPHENYRELHDAGLLGLVIPTAYGGRGADALTYVLCLLEMAKGDSSTALTFNMHSTILTYLAEMATEEQKRRYFGDVLERGKLIASITSEPGSSFRNTFVLSTAFQPVDGGYRVHGLKFFCSLGDAADYYFVSGMREGSQTAKEGLITAMVPRTSSGITVEGRWDAIGMRGTTSHTIRYNSVVDHSEVIGEPGQLLTIDLSTPGLGYAAVYLGVAEAACEFIVEYARTKIIKPSTEPLSHHPLTQRSIAEMATMIRAARLLLCEAARVRQEGDRAATALAVNQSKYYSAEVGVAVTERAIRLAGGRGILKDMPLERLHRDAIPGPVMPPANDRCLETIGKLLTGLRATTLEFQ